MALPPKSVSWDSIVNRAPNDYAVENEIADAIRSTRSSVNHDLRICEALELGQRAYAELMALVALVKEWCDADDVPRELFEFRRLDAAAEALRKAVGR